MPRRPFQWNGDIIPFKPASEPKPGPVERLLEPYLDMLFLSSEKLLEAEKAAKLLHIEVDEEEDRETFHCQGYYCELSHILELAEEAVARIVMGEHHTGSLALHILAADLEHNFIPAIDVDAMPLQAKRNGKRTAAEFLDILNKMTDALGVIEEMASAEVVPLL